MSIDKCGASFFKVREDLNGSKTARRNIKGLTDLSILRGPACYRHSGPYGPEERGQPVGAVCNRAYERNAPSV